MNIYNSLNTTKNTGKNDSNVQIQPPQRTSNTLNNNIFQIEK